MELLGDSSSVTTLSTTGKMHKYDDLQNTQPILLPICRDFSQVLPAKYVQIVYTACGENPHLSDVPI
jgi:hypothetical protein